MIIIILYYIIIALFYFCHFYIVILLAFNYMKQKYFKRILSYTYKKLEKHIII